MKNQKFEEFCLEYSLPLLGKRMKKTISPEVGRMVVSKNSEYQGCHPDVKGIDVPFGYGYGMFMVSIYPMNDGCWMMSVSGTALQDGLSIAHQADQGR